MAANVRPIKPLKVFTPGPVPDRLKGLKSWVVYALYNRPGRPGKTDKRPVDANGVPLKDWNTPAQLLTFEDALARLHDVPNAAGLGLCMRGQINLTGIDLDNVIKDGAIEPWAQEIVHAMGSYTERSPSNKGLRIFVEGETERDWTDHAKGIEVYGGHGKQFLTVTGDRLPDTAPGVNAAPAGMAELVAQHRRAPSTAADARPMPDLVEPPAPEDMDLPPYALAFMVEGNMGADRSKALQATVRAMVKRYDDATVLSALVDSPFAWEIALDHRRQDDDKAMAYIWKHVQDARAAVGPTQAPLDEFADLGQPDVEAPPFEHKATITEDPVAPVSLGFAAVEFTHDGVLPVGVTLIAGGHGSGKTSLLVSLACIETGELDGTDGGVGVELKRHSIYMAEDVGQVHRIRHGLIKHEGMVPNGRFHVVQSRRMSVEQVKAFITKCIERFTVVHESGYLIRPHITFDTTNACFDVQDENSASEVGAVMAAIKETSKGAPVWIVGHLPKAMLHGEVEGLTARGSGAWEADAQTTAFVVHADAKDLDNDVRWLVTKKRRFEAEYTEIRFETYTGTETVPTPWGSLQTLGYRYGVPSRAARGERKAAKEAAKEGKQTEHMAAQAQKATEYLMDLIDLHGEVWMRQGKKGGNTAPEAAKGKVIKWKDIYEFGVIRPNTEGPLRAAVFDSFEPFEGWGKLVPRPEGSLW